MNLKYLDEREWFYRRDNQETSVNVVEDNEEGFESLVNVAGNIRNELFLDYSSPVLPNTSRNISLGPNWNQSVHYWSSFWNLLDF